MRQANRWWFATNIIQVHLSTKFISLRPVLPLFFWCEKTYEKHNLWVRWVSKISVVSDFYKGCTFWLKLEICCLYCKLSVIKSRHWDDQFCLPFNFTDKSYWKTSSITCLRFLDLSGAQVRVSLHCKILSEVLWYLYFDLQMMNDFLL